MILSPALHWAAGSLPDGYREVHIQLQHRSRTAFPHFLHTFRFKTTPMPSGPDGTDGIFPHLSTTLKTPSGITNLHREKKNPSSEVEKYRPDRPALHTPHHLQ